MNLFSFLTRKDERGSKRHVHCAERGVGTLDRPRPEPSDDGKLLADERLEVGPFLRHLCRNLDRRIEVADAFPRFLANPGAIVAHVFRQAGGTGPFPVKVEFPLLRPRRLAELTGVLPANFGGISIMALLMSTATGLRSLA